jgi:hypothetical protein
MADGAVVASRDATLEAAVREALQRLDRHPRRAAAASQSDRALELAVRAGDAPTLRLLLERGARFHLPLHPWNDHKNLVVAAANCLHDELRSHAFVAGFGPGDHFRMLARAVDVLRLLLRATIEQHGAASGARQASKAWRALKLEHFGDCCVWPLVRQPAFWRHLCAAVDAMLDANPTCADAVYLRAAAEGWPPLPPPVLQRLLATRRLHPLGLFVMPQLSPAAPLQWHTAALLLQQRITTAKDWGVALLAAGAPLPSAADLRAVRAACAYGALSTLSQQRARIHRANDLLQAWLAEAAWARRRAMLLLRARLQSAAAVAAAAQWKALGWDAR